MKRQLYALLLLASLAVGMYAQKADVTEANLRRTIEYLASDKLEGRRTGEPGALTAAWYIAGEFKGAGLKPAARLKNGYKHYLQPFSFTPQRDPHAMIQSTAPVKTYDAYNVVGILPGHDPVLKNEAIVIGAHYDHLGHGGDGSLAVNSHEIHHGADDNASGVAAIIELARMFAAKHDNKRTLIFIAFSGEEEGLFGSNWYVNHPVFPLDKAIAMVNLDMVGRLKDNKLTVGGIGTASEWNNVVTSRNITAGPPYDTSQFAPTPTIKVPFSLQLNEDGFGPSDHSSFYGKKVPVLFFFTGAHDDYHKPSDTADKINYVGEHEIVDYIAAIVKAVDANARRPTYTVAKSSSAGRMGFNVYLGTVPNYADSDTGLLLDGVRDGSPAAKAGLKAGDRVVKLAGKDIRNVYDYTAALGEMQPDTEYEIAVVRGSERVTMKITPIRRQ